MAKSVCHPVSAFNDTSSGPWLTCLYQPEFKDMRKEWRQRKKAADEARRRKEAGSGQESEDDSQPEPPKTAPALLKSGQQAKPAQATQTASDHAPPIFGYPIQHDYATSMADTHFYHHFGNGGAANPSSNPAYNGRPQTAPGYMFYPTNMLPSPTGPPNRSSSGGGLPAFSSPSLEEGPYGTLGAMGLPVRRGSLSTGPNLDSVPEIAQATTPEANLGIFSHPSRPASRSSPVAGLSF